MFPYYNVRDDGAWEALRYALFTATHPPIYVMNPE